MFDGRKGPMTGDRVFYNSHEMAAEWPARIEAAQRIGEYEIGGVVYKRTRYGPDQGPQPCHDCGVLHGQFHVELVCDMEACPRCGEQVIACDCPYAADEASDTVESASQAEGAAIADYSSLVRRVSPMLDACAIMAEMDDGRFLPLAEGQRLESVVGLVAAPVHDGQSLWRTDAPAKELANAMSTQLGVSAVALISRRFDSFVGYYVSIRP